MGAYYAFMGDWESAEKRRLPCESDTVCTFGGDRTIVWHIPGYIGPEEVGEFRQKYSRRLNR